MSFVYVDKTTFKFRSAKFKPYNIIFCSQQLILSLKLDSAFEMVNSYVYMSPTEQSHVVFRKLSMKQYKEILTDRCMDDVFGCHCERDLRKRFK